MQQEQMSPVDTPQGTSPDPVDVFMERLIHRLLPLLTQQAAADAHEARRHELGSGHALADCSGMPDVPVPLTGSSRYQCWRSTTWSRLESISAATWHWYDKSCRSPGQYRV